MIKVGTNSKLHFHWKVNPYDFSKEKENSLLTKISSKYEISKDKVKIIPEFVMVNNDGEKLSVATEVISNIQNPDFQLKLFKDYLISNEIKDYDFELIKKIDADLNGKINYEVYDKYRQYTVKWVRWKNFLSYGEDNFFDFTTLKGLVLLNGEPANQSGKTTFAIDLLHFILFGKTSKAATQEKIFNKHLPEATEVIAEGCINIDGIDYVIKRTLKRPSLAKRSSRSKTVQKVEYYKIIGENKEELVEYIDNQQEENSIQTNKVIKEAIGSESDFDMIICATNSNLDELIEKKETDRGRLLSRWIGLLPIEEKDILAREKFNSEIKTRLLSTHYNSEQLKEDISVLKKNIELYESGIKKYIVENSELDKKIQESEKIKETLLSSKTQIDETLLKIDITTLEARLNRLIEDGKKKTQEVTLIDEELEAIGDLEFSPVELDNANLKKNELSVKINSIGERYKYIKSTIEALKKSEYCPTCGRKYENVDNTEKIKENEDILLSLTEDGKSVRSEIDNIDKVIASLKDKREKYDKKSKLTIKKTALQVNIEQLRNEYKDSNSILTEYNKNNEAIDKNNKIEVNVRNVDVTINTYRTARSNNESLINNCENDIKNAASEIKAREEIIEQLEKEAILVRNWRIYLDMVGKNGISKMVLRKTLPIINADISYLLSDICDFTVEISISDKNDIMFYLKKDGVYSDLTSASGFERTAAALALRIVLGGISTLPRPNFLILDELWGRVAKDNLENIHSLLDKVIDKYQFLLQISHLDEVKDWNTEIISIRKESNISKICTNKK